MSTKPHFLLRTIASDGTVRILGDVYKPDEDASRFAGKRAAFGLYWGPPHMRLGPPPGHEAYDARGLMDAVCLWGSEKAYRYNGDETGTDEEMDWPGPFCEDGYFKWEWWRRQ